MTISTSYAPDTYSGNGSLDTFAITFSFLSVSTNVKVSIKVDSTGVITEKTAATHYNVSGTNVVFTGGNIPASGETVLIELNPDFTQDSDYTENSALPAETLETDLDERCLEAQINNDLINRAIRFDSAVDLSSFTPTVPAATADQFIKITSAGTGLELSAGTSVIDALSKTDGNFYVGDGTTIVAESGATARTSLGVAIGTDVQAYDADLTTLATAFTTATASGAASLKFAEDTDNGTNNCTLQGPASTADVTVTLPAATDTLVGKATTDTLTNKTISLTNNTITGSTAEFNTALSDGSFATLAGTETLTGKTITLGGSLTVNGQKIVSTSNGDIDIEPNGTGNVLLGNFTLDADQTVGAGQDNYVLKYDDGTGLISLEAEAAGGIADVVDDTTPQLGGQLDVNGNAIGDGTRELLTFTEDASAVNHVNIENEATGSGPIISAAGDDANVDLNINAKGTGNIALGNLTFDADQSIGAGQDNYVLTYDNGGGLISLEAAAGGGGYTLISTATASASASVDFTSGIDSTYDHYEIHIINALPATDAVDAYIRTDANAGASFDNGASDYTWTVVGQYGATPTAIAAGDSADTQIVLNSGRTIGSGAGEGLNAVIRIYNPASTAETCIGATCHFTGTSGGEVAVSTVTGKRRDASNAVDAVQFLFSSGNIASGEFKLYGVKKS